MSAVYEETAGLMVNDPVLRTKKVNSLLISMCISQIKFTML
jgi:vacuolar-type H+-ATPase catalytic subunit A/Vma1